MTCLRRRRPASWCLPATIFLFSLVLTACTSVPPPVPGGEDAWSLTGRLGVRSGEQKGSFGIDWRQGHNAFDVTLFGPLGVTAARVYGDGEGVSMDVPGQGTVSAETPEALIARTLGMDIPVTPMRYWVRGEPAPGPWRGDGDTIRQFGWQVNWLARDASGLPTKIRLTRPEATLVLAIRAWSP